MGQEDTNQLQELRQSVMQELVGLSDYMASDEETSYELLLALARNTGNSSLLDKAFQKIKAIEDPKQKSDALIGLLDEIELTLSEPVTTSDEARAGEEVSLDQIDVQ